MPDCTFSPITPADGNIIIDLFNYYIEHSFAAYPEQKVPYEFFSFFLEATRNYPSFVARTGEGSFAGFGMLRSHNPMPVFRHTAEITCFLHPDWTGKGLGPEMLHRLKDAGKKQGITTILASISSLNEGSIRFFKKHGFTECGRFVKTGEKKGVVFDVIWLQKFL